MRKIALLAMLAIVAAMVPMTTATSQPTPGSLDGVGTLMIINDGLFGIVDLWIEIDDGDFEKLVLADTSQTEFQIPDGTHPFQLCAPGSTDETCAGSVALAAPGSVDVDENDIINFLVTAIPTPGVVSGVYQEENDTEATETDKAKLTAFSVIGVPLDICVGNDHVISLPGGAAQFQIAEFDSKDGETRVVKFFIPGAGAATDCSAAPTATTDLGFPSGSNTVINFAGPDCTSDCGYQIFPGEEPPNSDQLVEEFCAVVLEAANITTWLQDLFAEVEVGNPDTYPSPEKVEKVITRVAELLEKGNETAPDDIIDAWLTATASFVETGRLAAVDYDLEALPQDSLRDLVSLIDNPQADDEEIVAATDALAAWVPVNCFAAVETEPTFTG